MKALFQAENCIDSFYNKKHITYEVELKKDYKKVMVGFEYSPKFLEDETKARNIIIEVIENQLIGEEREKEEQNWEKYKNLKNFITISVDDKNGFRGCAHRKDQVQEHILAIEEADIGFIPGMIPKGSFKITVSIHALVTEKCKFKLYLYDMEDSDD